MIDYLSVDTEGAEFDILEHFDFDWYRPSVLTIGHNYRPERDKMIALLAGHGYVRAPSQISAYDDWFVCDELAGRLREIFTEKALRNE